MKHPLKLILLLVSFSLAASAQETSKTREPLDSLSVDTFYTDTLAVVNGNLRSSGGSYDVTMPDPICMSPETAGFRRYGETSVGEYTGTAMVSVPLYTFSYKGIEIPINLSYMGGGIEVAREASWVGLGWDMNIGGCVTYIAQGGNDQKYGRHGSWNDAYNVLNSDSADHFRIKTNLGELSFGDGSFFGSMHQDLKNGQTEYDFYSVNVLGRSFLFTWNPYESCYTIIGDASQVFKVKYSSPDRSWEIRDVDGYIYTFSCRELSRSGQTEYTSAWYLTDVTSPKGDYVTLSYGVRADYNLLPSFSQYYDCVTDVIPLYVPPGTSLTTYYQEAGLNSQVLSDRWGVEHPFLTSIVSEDGSIAVNLQLGNRSDLPGSKRLDGITVSSGISHKVIKSIRLNYSYFESCLRGGNYLAFPQKTTYLPSDLAEWDDQQKLRLKLLSVDELSADSIDTLRTSFSYYEDGIYQLPVKTSCAVDFWGYFNNRENHSTVLPGLNAGGYTNMLLPSAADCVITGSQPVPEELNGVNGAIRFADANYAKTFSLRRVTYPTGGYTEYEYELNSFTNSSIAREANSPSGPRTYSVMDINFVEQGTQYVDPPQVHVGFNVTSDSWGDITVTLHARSMSDLQKMVTDHADITLVGIYPHYSYHCFNTTDLEVDYSELTYTKTFYSLDMPATTYHLVANLPASLGNYVSGTAPNSISAVLTVRRKSGGTGSTQVAYGAGLRIRSISNHNHDGSLINRNVYRYVNEDGKSSGLLLIPLKLAETKRLYACSNTSISRLSIIRINSSSIGASAYTRSVSRGAVGYSQVVKDEYDADTTLLRSTVMTFENQAALAIFDDLYEFENLRNGLPVSQTVYAPDGTMESETLYTYNKIVAVDTIIKCNAYVECLVRGNINTFKTNGGGFLDDKMYLLTVYSYKPQWYSLSEKVERLFSADDGFTRAYTYTYHPTNHLPAAETFRDSRDSLTFSKSYIYPCDVSGSTIADRMTGAFYLSPVIEERLYKGGRLLRGRRNDYGYYGARGQYFFYPTAVWLKTGNGAYEKRLEYSYYSDLNLRSVTKDGTDKVTYLWSYGGAYPLAEVAGTDFAGLSQLVGSGWLTTLRASLSPSLSDLEHIRTAIFGHSMLMTGYLHEPGIGLRKTVSPSGMVTEYLYDGFNRLSGVKDNNGDTVTEYDYQYKGQ